METIVQIEQMEGNETYEAAPSEQRQNDEPFQTLDRKKAVRLGNCR